MILRNEKSRLKKLTNTLLKATNPHRRVVCSVLFEIFVRLRFVFTFLRRKLRTVAYSALALSLIFVLSTAESNVELTRKLDTMHVYSAQVRGEGWNNVGTLREQNLSEDAIFQQFNTSNSAFVGREDKPESRPTQVISEPSQTPTEVPTESVVEPIDDQLETVQIEEPIESDEENVVPESQLEPGVETETTSQTTVGSVVAFVTKLATALPFVHESIVEPADAAPPTVISDEELTPRDEPEQATLEIVPAPVVSEDADTLPPATEDAGDDTVTTESLDDPATPEVDRGGVPSLDTGAEPTALPSDKKIPSVTFSDFGLPALGSGQFITNVQLRLSLAAQPIETSAIPATIAVEYLQGDAWMTAGTILIDQEVSNALNGGYFLFALPTFADVEALADLTVRVSLVTEATDDVPVYLDAVWLEVDTETYDKEIFQERLRHDVMTDLATPQYSTLISDQLDFDRTEIPRFVLRYESQRNFAIRALRTMFSDSVATIDRVAFVHNDLGEMPVRPVIDITPDGLLTIRADEDELGELQPGTYTVEVDINEGGKIFHETLEFQWGLLAVNPDQTEYEVGDTATIALAALSPSGNTLCSADVRLYIIEPTEFITLVPVERSGLCNGNNVIDRPDYVATYTPEVPGEYEMYVEHVDSDGAVIAHTSDTFRVVERHNLSIARTGPTRIYPPALYPMEITVTAKESWSGELIEPVPADFTITETDGRLAERDGALWLVWDIDLPVGGSRTVSYSFDAPDISPYLYTVGPAKLVGGDGVVVTTHVPNDTVAMANESLTETIDEGVVAVDAPVDGSMTPESQIIEPAVPELNAQPPTTESAAADGESVMDTEGTISAPDVSVEEDINPVGVEEMPVDRNEQLPAASTTESVVIDGTNFAEHRAWQIASDATGSMIVFWTDGASIPSGWTCISCTATSTFYQRFPLGAGNYGSTSGTSTHTHTATADVDPSSGANSENNAGTTVAAVTHGHTITPTIASTSTLPAYRSLRVIQHNSAGTPATIPAGAILIFDSTLPTGWSRYTPLDGRYPWGENSITSSSTNTHQHTISGTTNAVSGSTYNNRTGGTQVTAANSTHTHTISSSTVASSHEPPYIEVIFATSSVATATPLNALAMWSDTPPAGWLDRSTASGTPLNGRFIKGSTSYGTTGGATTHTHSNQTVTSSGPTGTTGARSGAPSPVGSSNTHTHSVVISNYSSASNTPPAVSVIFAKYIGLVPTFDQVAYRWYVNTNAQTPTDPWPTGGTDVSLNQAIGLTTTPVKTGDIVRLRVQAAVTNSTTTGESFKLQYGTTTATCAAAPSWTDVGALASSTIWRGYNNGSVSDGVTLTSALLASTTVLASYEEINPTVVLPNEIGPDGRGEWDFVLQHNDAAPGTLYCFRLVESDGTELFAYTEYPQLLTNAAPDAPTLSKPFDNEKIPTATTTFEFVTTDDETNDLKYQIQIDDNYDFSSVTIDRNSEDNSTQFENLVTPADKDPFNNGELIRFTQTTALTNGTTYYWRVRASDPTASTEWGAWSTIYSFTVDTSVTVSTWFQTTEEQFDSNTLVGTDATGSDLVQLASGSTTGTTTSSQIDIQDGAIGNAWGTLSWTDNETVGDIKYRVQYLDTTSNVWANVPDADLSGNAAGFDTAPISLLTLDTDTYRIIRLVAVFTNSGGSPTLSDWTVSWGYRIDTPTLTAPFANEKVGTTTPTFRFTTDDPQADDLTYEIQWSTSPLFTSSTTRSSASHAGFSNVSDGGDTDPFTSGDTIRFVLQPADALTNNTTYWWRVRARDPLGDNTYSFWSTARAFTVDTTVTVSTWFQTTQEQFERNILSGTIGVAGGVSVATTATEAMLVYGEGTVTDPRYRLWDGAAWEAESSADTTGAAPTWVVTRAGTTREEYVAVTMGTNASVRAQVYADGAWDDLQIISSNSGNASARGFGVAYETLSGDAIVVSCNNTTNPIYYVWNGTTWTSGGSITMTYTGNCEWIQLASDPTSDEIVLLSRNAAGTLYEALVWNGSSWGNSGTLGSIANTASEGMAVVYEEGGGQAIVVTSDGNPARFAWRSWNGTAWAAAATVAISGRLQWGELVRNVGDDLAALCYVDHNNNVGVVRWDGGAWVGQTDLDLAANTTASRPVSCAFETTTGRSDYIMVAYSDATNVRYRVWNGATWAAEASIGSLTGGPVAQLRRTGDGRILGLFFDATNDRYDASEWNGSSWSTTATLESDASVGASPYKEPFMIAPRNASKEGVAVVSPPIVWSEGSGPRFAEFSWTDSQPGSSDIVYQLQYYDAVNDVWEFIPNSALSGNETGFTTSPIDLSGLSIATYHTIRPYATLSCDGSNNCPTITDWTVEWAEGVTISGTAQQADRTTNVTSGTVAVAVDGVLQSGKTGTISGGTWSIANVNLLAGDIVTVFVSDTTDVTEAVAVARYATTSNLTGIALYEGHLSLGSADATTTPLTNADIGLFDATFDEDLFFDVTGNQLVLCGDVGCGNASLVVRGGVLYEPRGETTLHDLVNQGTFRPQGNVVYVTGSWYNTATVTVATSSVSFTATTTTETINETGAVSGGFYNLTFGTTTGAATWTLGSPLTVQNDLTVARGTLARGTTSIAVSGNLLTSSTGFWTGVGTTTFTGAVTKSWTDNNSTKQNIGHAVIDGTSKTINLGSAVVAESITIGADDILDVTASNYALSVNANWTNNNTFVPRNGTVNFIATTTNRTITPGTSSFHNLTFNGAGGAWSFTSPTVTVLGDLTITLGTLTLPTGTTTITGSFTNSGGTFAHNNGVVLMNASVARTITQNGTPFTNAFYNLRFNGSGSWSFTDANATTSNDFIITQGTVTLPSGVLSVGSNFLNTTGTFAHNSGTVRLYGSATHTIDTNASFSSLTFTGSGAWSFVDTNVTLLGNLTTSAGTLTLPTGTLTLGGSLLNTATLTAGSSTVLFNSTDGGETISLGASSLYNATFASATGGWTITAPATTTNNFTLATSSAFTLASGQSLAVGGIFTNSVGGASTTWTGSTLSLENGTYSVNSKTSVGDVYDTLRIKASADISFWNSRANSYQILAGASLYSQDHDAVDGALHIFGSYERTSGTEYWSYHTDFDGTNISSSTRAVAVRFADTATAAFTNSTLNIVGSSTGSTTIANQGSGSYTIAVAGGTTTASYYEFANLGLTGLTLSGTNRVTSLAHGRFVPGVASGTGLTVSSTTIDANPGLQIFNVNFSTTTAITATNVTQTGGAPTSFWWFRESTGNLSGEAYDNDSGDPGSIRWDNSSLTITVSGTVYSDDETTTLGAPTCGAGTPVRVVVEGGATYDGACDGSGNYSIANVVIVGDPTITVYLNGAAGGERAVTVTKTPTTDITDLDLIVNRVMVRHEDVDPMTIADMASFDSTDDTDVIFTAATGTTPSLTVAPNNELHVMASTTFNPGGTVTLLSSGSGETFDGSLHLAPNATFTGAGTTTYAIGGTFTLDTGATFVPASSTVLMTATTTGKAIVTTGGETATFNELQFTGVGGGWNLNGNVSATANINVATGTLTGTGNVTLTNGSFYGDGLVSLGTGTTTIERTNTLGGTQGWTFANLVFGNGSVVGTTTPATSATTTVLGKLTIATGHFLDAGSSVWDLRGTGTVFVEQGTFLEDTSTVRYSGTQGSSVLSTNYYNLRLAALGGSPTYIGTGLGIVVLNDLTVGGASTTNVSLLASDPALDVNGTVTITSNGTLVASDTGVFTVGGSWDNDGTFTGSGGTVTFDSAGTKSIASGNSSWSNLVINGAGTFTLTENATVTAAFTLTNASSFTVNPSTALAVGGTFTNGVGGGATTWTNSTLYLYGGGNYSINASTTNDQYATLVVGPNTDIRMWNSSAVTTQVDATGSLYSQDHAAVNGDLYIYGDYVKTTGADYWSYARDFDGTDLTGGGERQVDVYFAANANALYLGGSLEVTGGSAATTTMQNQGSGTFGFRIGGTASTSMSFYRVRDINPSGLVFSGTARVVTLSNGDIVVTQSGGTAMTVGGTVIDQNPAKTFTNNYFATSSPITAYNVTATGTSVSSWRFTNHTGSLAGEQYDVDPDGNPGYVVWDNSSSTITISGIVYSDEGTTPMGGSVCDGSTPSVHIRVAGLTSYTGSCAAGTGAYSISGISYSPGDSLIAYIDGETEKAASVSRGPVSNINNFHLYENRVIVRHEDTTPLSIANMAVWDSSDDADIPFTAVDAGTDTLTLPANRKLIVWTSKEFEPNGNVTVTGGGGGAAYDGTLELFANATFDGTGTETHTIGGSLISGAGATIDAESTTFVFTTTGAARTVDTNEDDFYNLTFNGSGSWTITNTALVVGNDFTLTQGAVTLPSATTTIGGSFLNTGGTFNQNGGQMLFTSSAAESIRQGGSSFGTTTFTGTGSWTYLDFNATSTGDYRINNGTVTAASGTLAIGGDFVNAGTFAHNSGTLRLTSSKASTTVTADGSDLFAVTFASPGSFIFTDTNVALLGTLRIENGTVTFATGTLSIAGSLLNTGGAFNHASGTVLFNSSDTGETINPGTSVFNTVSIAAPTGGYTLVGSATTTGNFSLTSALSFTVNSGVVLAVEGIFTNLVGDANTTWTGSTLKLDSNGVPYTINTKIAGGDVYNLLILDSNTDVRMWNSNATTTILDTQSSLYSQDHSGINGELYIYGFYERTTGADYWSYATDFDGAALTGVERLVTVRFANGATSTFSGGALEMIGASGATTTITNQGAGTYGLIVQGGTISATHYALRNQNAAGLVLSGATTSVSALDYGDFELAVNGGSLITLSADTLNYNASLVVTGVRFATTTAITGANVALVGTTSSSWRFTTHRGNLDGEAYDVDGATACGSVRWDDSTCLLTEQTAYRWRADDGGEGVPDSEWFDQDWSKRTRVTITNADGTTYTDAVVKVVLPYDADMQGDFDDIRFTAADGVTARSFVRETFTVSTEAIFWVKVPSLTAAADTILYAYYGNGGAAYAGVGTTTFAAYDDFEDGNLTEYTSETSLFNVDGSFAYQGSNGLEAVNTLGKTTLGLHNFNATTSQGQTIRFFQYVSTAGNGASDETCALFGVQSPAANIDNYAVCLEQFGVDRVSIAKNVFNRDIDGIVLSSTTISYTTGWYEVEARWATDDTIAVSVYRDGSLVATTSAIDGDYTTGGIGFTYWGQHGGWDLYSARPLLTTEPTVTIGGEQVPGGASWLSALNQPLSGVTIGTTIRPRFVIENTGLTVSDAYRIQYAPKGASPSCLAVSAGAYTTVPAQAACTGSPVCMQSSVEFTNEAATTDVLGGTGTFVAGQIIEDPSNTTQSLSLDSNEYTEVEYALTLTNDVTDSNYCFRVTDAGTSLDSYAKVAEVQLVFEPTITALSLNGGGDIILNPGATTTVTATGTVSDLNGYADIVLATTTIFRSGVSAGCALDANNCYRVAVPQCTFSNCSGTSCNISCSVDMYYHADPTDVGAYGGETWRAELEIRDQSGAVATATAPSIDLLTLRAIAVDDVINYGALEVNADTGSYNASTSVENIGNDSIDVSVEGTNLTDGGSSVIPVNQQKFATSTFTYSACVFCSQLDTTPTNLEVALPKPASTTPSVTDTIFWGIAVPYGVAAVPHQGLITFVPVSD